MPILSSQPAFMVPNELAETIESHAMYTATFENLTRRQSPWDIEIEEFDKTRKIVAAVEEALDKQTSEPRLCIATESGMHWLGDMGFQAWLNQLEAVIRSDQKEKKPVLWRYTAAEMRDCHINNLRTLILASAHDIVFLSRLKTLLNGGHALMQREFKLSEQSIWRLIKDIKKRIAGFAFVDHETVILYERCLITENLLQYGELSADELGYDPQRLRQVHDVLENRLRQANEDKTVMIKAIANDAKYALRSGETTYLIRFNRWEMVRAMLAELPEAFRPQFEYFTREKKRLAALVALHEQELGASEAGQAALTEAASQTPDAAELEAPGEPEPEEGAATEGESKPEPEGDGGTSKPSPQQPNKKKYRMAVLERRSK